MSSDDVDYYIRRATQEYAAAWKAQDGLAAMAHLTLAELYIEKIQPERSVAREPSGLRTNDRVAAFG